MWPFLVVKLQSKTEVLCQRDGIAVDPTVDQLARIAAPILKKHKVTRAGLFGSAVRGQLRPRSDIDILVDISEPIGLFDFVGIKLELEDAFGRKVDLAEYGTIKPLIRERILREEVPIL